MNHVQIVAYSENVFNFSSEVKEEMLKDQPIGVGINPMLRYKDGTNAIGCQLRIVYTIEGKFVMEYAAVITVYVNGWKDFLEKKPSDAEIIAASKSAWQEAIGFARGAICVNASRKGSETIARMMLPNVDMEKFMSNVTIEKVG